MTDELTGGRSRRVQAAGDPRLDHRLDHRLSDIVEHGILLQSETTSIAALEYLRAFDVSPTVIRRVLLEPGLRRQGGKMLPF